MKAITLTKLAGFVLLVGLMSSCIEQKLTSDPDGQIVVIGNGISSGQSFGMKTLVVDVTPKLSGAVQSLIVEPTKVVTVQDKLKAIDSTPKSAVPAASATAMRLGWMVPGGEDGQVILKVSAEKSVDASEVCEFYLTAGQKIECLQLEDLRISDHVKPEFRKDGSVFYIDEEGNLRFSVDRVTSHLLAKGAQNFFFDNLGALYYKSQANTWAFFSKASLVSARYSSDVEARLLSNADLFYRTASGSVFLFPIQKGVGLSEGLDIRSLYQFNSEKESFQSVWTPAQNLSFSLKGPWAVQGDSLFLVADISEPNIIGSRRGLIEVGPKGVRELPLAPFAAAEILVGAKNIFVKPASNKPSKYIGQVCSLLANDPTNFQCKTLALPEGERSILSTLEDDQIVLAISKLKIQDLSEKDGKQPQPTEAFEVVGLNSDLGTPLFGQIVQNWSIADPIKELRFFDLTSPKIDSRESQPQKL